jgi:NAD(P)-dependent dehydrogenase (short-subunit alcohol dehydrogenase family)
MRLAHELADVVVADMDASALESTVKAMSDDQLKARAVHCDVRESKQVTGMVQQVLDWHGRIDILMHIAGIAPVACFLDLTEETWDNTVDTNLRGAFLVARAVTPHMVERKYGKLVFMASTNSWDAEPKLSHYNVSKAGVFLLAKSLARELGRYGINSNAVGPGCIRTRLSAPALNEPDFIAKYNSSTGVIPLGRLGTPEDVAGPALFLASADASYINGVLLFVDGGQLA